MKKTGLTLSIFFSTIFAINSSGQTHNETVTIKLDNYGPKLILDDPNISNKIPIEFKSNGQIKWEFGLRPSHQNYDFGFWRYDGNYKPTLWFNHSNGNVGIGTMTPGSKLEIGVTHTFNQDETLRIGSYYNNEFNGLGMNYRINSSGIPSNHLVSFSGSTRTSIMSFNNNSLTFPNGNVGIGTTNPNYKLEINSPNSGINIVGANSRIYFNGNRAIEGSQDHSSLDFGEGYTNVSFRNSGNVGIGTTNTRGFKLAVKGKIGAEEIQVHAPGYWPDYVFSTDYNLKPLSEVESFIEQNNHLPDIPSEKEVKEKGINIGDMNAKLLQKIEELTLYMIEQNKKIDKMQTRLDILENK